MYLVKTLSAYSLLYNYLIPSIALRLKRLSCCCVVNFKSAYCQMGATRELRALCGSGTTWLRNSGDRGKVPPVLREGVIWNLAP
jgi:hypothetical protein